MTLRTLLAPALLFSLALLFAPGALAQEDARSRAAAEIESLREQIKAREAVLLAPSNEDRKAYAELIAQGAGLVRLLPREKWDGKLSTRGGGAYYSFTRLTHEYGYGSDISLEQDMLSVGFAGADFGFMVNLGDAPVETVTAETEAVRFMASYATPSNEPDARKAQRQFMHRPVFKDGEWTYQNRLPVSVGSTYALRSVNYEDSDVLVVFRVVRKDADGSVTLVWKILQKYSKPSLRGRAVASGR
jgi:hypothetical protein